jgi:hypothetical protein
MTSGAPSKPTTPTQSSVWPPRWPSGRALDAAGRVRIEQLATRTAEPALKQALEATATDDTDAQLRALTRAARRR